MKYGWNVTEIETKLQKVKNNKNKENNVKVYTYQRMIRDYSLGNHPGKVMIDSNMFFKAVDNFDINYFENPFFKTISYLAPQLKKLNFNYACVFQDSISGDDIVKICRDFYKKADKSNMTYFKQFTNVPTRIQFIEDNGLNPFNGRTYIINSSEYYVLVNHRNYLQDIITFNHESKHVENLLKGYNDGIALYQELSPILYSHYMLDYLEVSGENIDEAEGIRKSMLAKYCNLIIRINDQMEYMKQLKNDSNFYDNIKMNYEFYSEMDNLSDLYILFQRGFKESDIGHVLSFLVSIYIYLNSNIDNAQNAVSLYMFGMHKMKPAMLDEIVKYIKEVLDEEKTTESFFQKIKKNS